MDRIDLYLQQNIKGYYTNTPEEVERVEKFVDLYTQAKAEHEAHAEANPSNIAKWRKAYKGTLNALDIETGEESNEKSRSLKKLTFEMVESKVDNSIPMPKMIPRYKSDLFLVDRTENYLKYEADRILTKSLNDKSERATYIDGTSWYKVSWNSLDNTHERSGDVRIDIRLVDQIIPQPGIIDYHKMEYIFERQRISVSTLYDLYGRMIMPSGGDINLVDVVSCYYLNENHIVGLFMWAEASNQVICDEKDWQIRKVRTCTNCGNIVPQGDICGRCGNNKFKYKPVETEVLDENLMEIYNPYDVGETTDEREKDRYASRVFIAKGTTIPMYHIRQLPFVPRPAISDIASIYGLGEAWSSLDCQDVINKTLTKMVDKTLKGGTVVTKPSRIKLSDTNDTIKVLNVRNVEEAGMVQAKQIMSDTSQDIVVANLLYENAREASGITDSFQGKRDTTATSGKAKQYAAAQSAGRIESLRVMKATAFAGVYELVLKYLLAFSNEPRKFVRILPDGQETEMIWSKYLFLAKDEYGNIYYRDDFKFDTDPASTLSQSRVQMWQEIQDKFINGALGVPTDPRTLELYWHMLDQLQYPLAKTAIAGIKDSSQHLPPEIEQALLQDQEALAAAMEVIQAKTDGRGGARPNSGPEGNGATHSTNVERTNERNRSQDREVISSPQQQGGIIA